MLNLNHRISQLLARQPIRCCSTSLGQMKFRGRRFLNMETAPIFFQAGVKVFGAGNAHIECDEGFILDLAVPRQFGGKGGKPTTGHLFAGGYSACFQASMNLAANKIGVRMPVLEEESIIETTVALVGYPNTREVGWRVHMKIRVKGVSEADMKNIVEEAKKLCPYANAIKGNVPTIMEIIPWHG